MTTYLHPEILDPAMLADMLTAGYVRKQVHPTEPLTILNYTEKAAYESVWNNVTRRCRGLIYNHETMEVVARPFAKFMNHGQVGADIIDLDSPVHVSDKMDGSLGILYLLPSGGWAIATRGSFASEQAVHATALLNDRYLRYWTPTPGLTVLVEIVYPRNRIVVDYGDRDELVLLGQVGIRDGAVYDPSWVSGWPGPTAATFYPATFAQALALPPRPNAEGIVVRCLNTGGMVKVKQEDYIALHRIVTGLNARTVWQHLVDGKPLNELIEPLPDEFHGWVHAMADGIQLGVSERHSTIVKAYSDIILKMAPDWDETSREGRATFARIAGQHPDRSHLFALLDGRDILSKLLTDARPDAFVTPSGRILDEATA